jgi:tRNA-(ms[2]io[6]A)-hydroxylase
VIPAVQALVAPVCEFLRCATPAAWYEAARDNLPTLLIDHANCEKKAASTALGLLYRYVDKPELLFRMSRLAREELRHFEQVHRLLQSRDIAYRPLTASRYAGALMALVPGDEPLRLVDTLLVGAIVEARSCERFAGLVAVLPEDVAVLYAGLLASEARHFQQYLALAHRYSSGDSSGGLDPRLDILLARDADLVMNPDPLFRFHSGPPA